MKIFVTGATGFVGSHTALELLDAGHELCLLVRDIDAAKGYFTERGYEQIDFVLADMRDKKAVLAGMRGCDAVFHAAAMVSLDARRAKEVYKTNTEGIEVVMTAALELCIDNIVWVSSLSVLSQHGVETFDESAALGNPTEAYSRSKSDSEKYVRGLQEQGAPIQISYPSGVFGPDDPKLSESNKALGTFLLIVPNTSTGIQCVDVRDVAVAHRYLIENPLTEAFHQGRYILGGHYYSWKEFHALMERVSSRKIFSPRVPGAVMRFFGSIVNLVKKIFPLDTPISLEAMVIVTQGGEANSAKILETVSMSFRPGDETMSDSLRWQVRVGHLDEKRAGISIGRSLGSDPCNRMKYKENRLNKRRK